MSVCSSLILNPNHSTVRAAKKTISNPDEIRKVSYTNMQCFERDLKTMHQHYRRWSFLFCCKGKLRGYKWSLKTSLACFWNTWRILSGSCSLWVHECDGMHSWFGNLRNITLWITSESMWTISLTDSKGFLSYWLFLSLWFYLGERGKFVCSCLVGVQLLCSSPFRN